MAMGKTAVAIDLTDSERRELGSLALAAEGVENKDICERVGASPNAGGKWRRRFAERRMEGLVDEPRPGAHRSTEELKAAIVSYIDAVNAKPRPFVWTKSPDDSLASVKRFCAATLSAAQTQNTIATSSESGD
jgi:hypothetical protein